jgi:hypothetical protein
MAIVARVTAGSVVVAVRSRAALWRLLGWSRMGLVGLVVVVVVHGVSMMPSRHGGDVASVGWAFTAGIVGMVFTPMCT